MSHGEAAASAAVLAQLPFKLNASDPTETLTLRRRFATAFSQRQEQFKRENADWFAGRTQPRDEARFLRRYRRFVGHRPVETILEPVDDEVVVRGMHWTGTFVRQAYDRGLTLAERDLVAAGYPERNVTLATRATARAHESRRAREYLTAYYEAEDIVERLRGRLTRAVKEGVQNRRTPEEMVASTAEVVETVGTNATNALANTVVVETVNEALLTSFERVGAESVGFAVERDVSGTNAGVEQSPREAFKQNTLPPFVLRVNAAGELEWETAGDDDVCQDCQALEGMVVHIADVRDSPQFQPPIHPNCRCRLVPTPMTVHDDDIPVPETFTGGLRAETES